MTANLRQNPRAMTHLRMPFALAISLFVASWGGPARAVAASTVEADVTITAPPESFFEIVDDDVRDDAREFYAKYASAGGLPVVASEEVADEALERTCDIVAHMLAGRPDVLQEMIDNKMYLIIIGKDQLYCDMPENRNVRDKDYMNERVRGTGGRPTSFGEENLLSLALDRYDDESIGVHEFCHTIDGALRSVDPDWRDRLRSVYRSIKEKGLYKGAYASSNPGEYWAEIGQAYFDCNRINNYNHGPIGTREELRVYDPEGYELARSTFNLSPEQDWRYTFLQKHPVVIDPPAKFDIDPYYTKFSWAREFPVIGRGASDEAMLDVNDTIRKMFTYRHDVLKALINGGTKLVVLGEGETLADLPEADALVAAGYDPAATEAPYSQEANLIVVDGESVTADASEGGSSVIRLMADAAYQVTSHRPVDPDWENRGRAVQQYEIGVERLDVRFDAKLKDAFEHAKTKGKWAGLPAAKDRVAYFTTGVAAYFDASGSSCLPDGADSPIATREALQAYDPELYELVHETMAYGGRVDWRFRAANH